LTHAGQALNPTKIATSRVAKEVGDVDVGMSPVVLGGHDLPVLPDPENQCQQKDQPGRQQGDSDVDSQRAAKPLIGARVAA
jgi:hypothetical protein